MPVRIQEGASHRIDEIYRYTRDKWGDDQAERYIIGLFDAFDRIETHDLLSRAVPAEFGVQGYYCRYEHHYIYWRRLADGAVGIVSILHERMHLIDRFREDADKK